MHINLQVVQYNGYVSTSEAYVSYRQCQPGEYEDGLSCLPCPEGTYQSAAGQTSCKQLLLVRVASLCDASLQPTVGISCPSGYFSNYTGATACTACPAGYAQVGRLLTRLQEFICPCYRLLSCSRRPARPRASRVSPAAIPPLPGNASGEYISRTTISR